MRRTTKLLICALALLACGASAAPAQEQPYASETDEYAIELPSEVWKAVPRPDSEHRHVEFVNGVRPDGYLLVRRDVVGAARSSRSSRAPRPTSSSATSRASSSARTSASRGG